MGFKEASGVGGKTMHSSHTQGTLDISLSFKPGTFLPRSLLLLGFSLFISVSQEEDKV